MRSATVTSAGSILPELERRSRDYRSALGTAVSAVREWPDTLWPDFSEKHLQCIWYDPQLRPPDLRDSHGEPVVVDSPGEWNLEAGPDFLGAGIRVGGRVVTGDVEVHIHPRDWHRHGHAGDRQYRNVRIHVTYFAGRPGEGRFRPGVIHLALAEPLRRVPGFSFEAVDVTAYPFSAPAPPTPCQPLWKKLGPDFTVAFLESAGAERMRRKALRLRGIARNTGMDQALYEEIMSALGYRRNKQPFRELAARATLTRLRERCGADPLQWYAVLLGVAGLLPPDIPARWPPATRRFVRHLWDRWWKQAAEWREVAMEPRSWQKAGVRPANRPERRLAAAAYCFCRHDPAELLQAACKGGLPAARRILHQALNPPDSFWSRRLAWSGTILPRPAAMVGTGRINAILGNVLVPAAAAFGWSGADLPPEHLLPAEPMNSIMKHTAHALFGRDHPPSLYRSGLARQGLLQVAADFCFEGRAHCLTCRLADLLRERLRSTAPPRSLPAKPVARPESSP